MRPPEFWRRDGGALGALLAPLGAIWGRVTAARASRAPDWRAPVPVVCIGNAVLGGAGKTLVALDVLGRFAAAGRAPHAILRGYGGRLQGPLRVDPQTHTAADVGDEALLLARTAPTWIGADRVASAREAANAGAHVIVMDDGFQNPSLAKTLSLLVVDAAYGFGNGRAFPAGPLREPVAGAVARADALIRLGDGMDLTEIAAGKPVFGGSVKPADPTSLSGRKVFAFAGIGRPEKFFRTLDEIGAEVVGHESFADHHPFTEGNLQRLLGLSASAEATLVTTEKDHVRLPAASRALVKTLPVRIDWADAPAFETFLMARAGLD